MKVLKVYNQYRRDCHCDLICESCGEEETITNAYDDRNYWENVIPNKKCIRCDKSSIDLDSQIERISTKYPENQIV